MLVSVKILMRVGDIPALQIFRHKLFPLLPTETKTDYDSAFPKTKSARGICLWEMTLRRSLDQRKSVWHLQFFSAVCRFTVNVANGGEVRSAKATMKAFTNGAGRALRRGLMGSAPERTVRRTFTIILVNSKAVITPESASLSAAEFCRPIAYKSFSRTAIF
jgi:hypothetical protein